MHLLKLDSKVSDLEPRNGGVDELEGCASDLASGAFRAEEPVERDGASFEGRRIGVGSVDLDFLRLIFSVCLQPDL